MARLVERADLQSGELLTGINFPLVVDNTDRHSFPYAHSFGVIATPVHAGEGSGDADVRRHPAASAVDYRGSERNIAPSSE